MDRDIYPLPFAHIHPITSATLLTPPARTSTFRPSSHGPGHAQGSPPMACFSNSDLLGSPIISAMGPSRYLHTLLQGPCMHHPRKIQVTSADPRPALRFPRVVLHHFLYASQPLLSRLLPETLWYTSSRTVDRSNVATQ